MNDIDSVNHVGIVVRDLAATVDRYEAMGFGLTPFSPHSGAWKPGETIKPLGSGNRCVMFASSYLEILANADPAILSERLAGYLRHHQGAHIICFGSQRLQAVDDRLRTSGVSTSGVIPLQRDVDTPQGVRTAKFERVQFAPDDSPEGYIQAAHHLTPDYVYQRRYIEHPNGCTALSDVYLVVDDVVSYASRYERYTGLKAQTDSNVAQIRFPLVGALTIMTPKRALERLPATLYPPLPGIAAVAFLCPDVSAQRKRLREAGIYATDAGNRVIVPAELASGVAVVFENPQ
ncbi:MAG TPA: VOC family protein [Casimicrobiaceae bacterium]|nr:VOC family protein [Casimicrobiaceae bacterium]